MDQDIAVSDQEASPPEPAEELKPIVLELQRVAFRGRSENSIRLQGVDLVIRQGELVTVHLDAATSTRELASMLQGLIEPSEGKVIFFNQDWLGNDHDRHFRMRSRIGRVFTGQAWLENLNVDENVTLSCRHHGVRDDSISEQVGHWLARLGLDRLSRTRPAFTEPSVLQTHQWIRAFIGSPSLLILERPLQFLSQRWMAKLIDAVDELRSRGAAVLWFSSDQKLSAAALTAPWTRLALKGNQLRPFDGGTGDE